MMLVLIVVLGLLIFAFVVASAAMQGREDTERARGGGEVVPTPMFDPGDGHHHGHGHHDGGVHGHDAGSLDAGGHGGDAGGGGGHH